MWQAPPKEDRLGEQEADNTKVPIKQEQLLELRLILWTLYIPSTNLNRMAQKRNPEERKESEMGGHHHRPPLSLPS